MKQFFLSVVIPSYNEMANLQKGTLDKVEHYLVRKKYHYEIVIVDDGSTDGSREFVEEFIKDSDNIKLIKNNHTGKAGAVTRGMIAAKGDYILFTDMDQATPIEELEKFLPYIEEGRDVIIGSRPSRPGAPFSRQIMSKSNVFLRKMLVGLPRIADTQCGFKLFKKKGAEEIFNRIKKIHNGFKTINGSSVTSGFDLEILLLAESLGYSIKEVPVKWLYVESRRVSPIRDSIEGLLDLLRIRKNIANGKYLTEL